jgi:hypothetical protein
VEAEEREKKARTPSLAGSEGGTVAKVLHTVLKGDLGEIESIDLAGNRMLGWSGRPGWLSEIVAVGQLETAHLLEQWPDVYLGHKATTRSSMSFSRAGRCLSSTETWPIKTNTTY